MKKSKQKQFVISLGGSVVCPDDLDIEFLKKFRMFIASRTRRDYKFIIIVGGGFLARSYQKAGALIGNLNNAEKDWIGIASTYLNAMLVKTIFGAKAHPVILDKRGAVKGFNKRPIIVGSGWEPGASSDMVAVQTAVDFGISTVINLGKPDFVYTADPEKVKTAKPIKCLTWQSYFKIIPKKWIPGMNTPFDPIAGRFAERNNIKVIVADGHDIKNLTKILQSQPFRGTTISDNE